MKKRSIAITISDGWAYRYLFSTSAIEYLTKEYDITLICSNYYYKLLNNNKFNCVKIKHIKYSDNIDNFLISSLNFIYRNSFKNQINNFYISKYQNYLKYIYYLFIKWHISFTFSFFERLILLLIKFKVRLFYNKQLNSSFESVLFLSPYTHNEIILSFNLSVKSEKIFILPSWDNIYKYYLFDNFNKYVVWGNTQKIFLQKKIKKTIIISGNIGQYAINKILLNFKDNPKKKSLIITYSTVTRRIFNNEIKFLTTLTKMIEDNHFGENVHLIIRPHPADKNITYYKKFISNRVTLSSVPSVSLEKWDVDRDFYTNLIHDFINADLVLNVASTITLDAILLNRFVLNIRPKECQNDMDYYNFQHYLPIKTSNLVPIIHENEIEKLFKYINAIKNNNTKLIINQSNAISSLTKIHNNYEVSYYFNEILK
jgi:hypothetical protein